MTDVEDLIDMTEGSIAPAAPPICHAPTLPKLKTTIADRLFAKWVYTHCDTYDFTFDKWQIPNDAVVRHMNSIDWRDRLKKLRKLDIAVRRSLGMPIYVRPLRRFGQPPTITIRFDADAHKGQTDAKELIDWLNAKFFGGTLYSEPSKRGHGAWAVFELVQMHANGRTWYDKRATTNELLNELAKALEALCKAKGFAASIEVNGRYTITAEDEQSGDRRIIHRGGTFKLPTCPSDEAVQKLLASRFSFAIVHHIIEAATQLPAQSAFRQAMTSVKVVEPRNVAKLLTRCSGMISSGDKHRDRVKCVRKAFRQLYGPARNWDLLTDEQIETGIDLASALYECAGLNGGQRDRDRDQAFKRIVRWMIRSHDERAKGSDGVWFDGDDLMRAETLLRSILSRAELDVINDGLKRKITYCALAVALCTYAKNIHTSSDSSVPSASIKGMLRFFDKPCHGSNVRRITDTLIRLGLIECIDPNYTTGQARRFRATGQSYSLPFMIELKPDQEVAQDQVGRYAPSGRGRGQQDTVPNLISLETSIGVNATAMTFDFTPIEVIWQRSLEAQAANPAVFVGSTGKEAA